jgi:hypothetical protein
MGTKNRFKLFAAALAVMITAILICTFAPHRVTFKAIKPKLPANSYSILIDTDEKLLYLLNNGIPVKKYSVAVGKSSTPSPLGSYHITQKSHWGEGFGGYWLGIDCPWGIYGIHGTTKPCSVGYPLSHGCFRMYNSDIEELYKTVPVGTPVNISGGEYGAFGNGWRNLGPGMYGRDVQVVQIRLKDIGYFKGYCNGRYSTAGFLDSIHKFQHDFGLPASDYINKKMLSVLGFVMMD